MINAAPMAVLSINTSLRKMMNNRIVKSTKITRQLIRGYSFAGRMFSLPSKNNFLPFFIIKNE